MKKLFLLLFLIIILSACSNNTGLKDGSSIDQDADEMGKQIEDIIDRQELDEMGDEMGKQIEDFKDRQESEKMGREISEQMQDVIDREDMKEMGDKIGKQIEDVKNREAMEEAGREINKEMQDVIDREDMKEMGEEMGKQIDNLIKDGPESSEENSYTCDDVCNRYRACAMMGAGVTSADGDDAYNTCYEECQNWSDDTITCIGDTNVGTAMGCANLSMCAIAEYNK